MTERDITLSITSIRSRGRRGGVIMAGRTDAGDRFTVSCSYQLVPDAQFPEKNQQWRIAGPVKKKSITVNGRDIIEDHIDAVRADYLRPSGKHIIRWIAVSPDIGGVGEVKARKLYTHFGTNLIAIIDSNDEEALSLVVSREIAKKICRAFQKSKIGETLLWLERNCISRHIGQQVINFYGNSAPEKIASNPYCLISFCANWKGVDELARTHFEVKPDDPRRLEAAVEEALYRGLNDGHTCLPKKLLKTRLRPLLGNADLIDRALDQQIESVLQVGSDLYQTSGAHFIEHFIAEKIFSLLKAPDQGQISVFGDQISFKEVTNVIEEYEEAEQIKLSDAQRDAIICSIEYRFSVIFGGAGTGKTTVLKAIYETLDIVRPGIAIFQLALSGMAAQRMTEATGRTSMTIAGFIHNLDESQLGDGSMLVIDEASMIDVILMYRLLMHVPPSTRIILVGDPSQLPPIGPGLVLHALYQHPAIPQTELKVVKRQAESSGIPIVARSVRNHEKPEFTAFSGISAGVSFVECPESKIDVLTLELYEELGGSGDNFDVQILCATKSNAGGTININAHCHNRFSKGTDPVKLYSPEFGVVEAKTYEGLQIYVGDLVLATKNDYQTGLRNGSLGRVKATFTVENEELECCVIEFDGVDISLNSTQVENLVHAYGITIHKSQGSQFDRVIVPLRQTRLLDQALIYTAITRGVKQVVLVGDLKAATTAILTGPSSNLRNTTLRKIIDAIHRAV